MKSVRWYLPGFPQLGQSSSLPAGRSGFEGNKARSSLSAIADRIISALQLSHSNTQLDIKNYLTKRGLVREQKIYG